MKNRILLLLFLAAVGTAKAQQIQNVQATQEGKTIVVSYDLTDNTSGSAYDVELYCSTDGGSTFGKPLSAVSGDAGKEIKPGASRRISWDVLAEREKLTGNRIVFEVRARTTDKTGIEMVFVKGGTFTMGCTSEQSDCDDDEKPAHQVTVSDFRMGKYEVTQKQWTEIIGSNPSSFKNCEDCPVENVSWNDVQEFIKQLNRKTGKNYRLPTEAEWEYAARGGSTGSTSTSSATATKYAGSNSIDEVAWYDNNSGSKTHPVGQKKPNELGLYDMTGNVWEWCSDWYGSDYYKNSPRNNPQGSASGSNRVLRGGSWSSGARYCRVALRNYGHPVDRVINDGFRLVLAP
jgi:formylglycine-generating enzyme required for sulfatase activity